MVDYEMLNTHGIKEKFIFNLNISEFRSIIIYLLTFSLYDEQMRFNVYNIKDYFFIPFSGI